MSRYIFGLKLCRSEETEWRSKSWMTIKYPPAVATTNLSASGVSFWSFFYSPNYFKRHNLPVSPPIFYPELGNIVIDETSQWLPISTHHSHQTAHVKHSLKTSWLVLRIRIDIPTINWTIKPAGHQQSWERKLILIPPFQISLKLYSL